MMTTEVQELKCEQCGFPAMNERSLRAHVGMIHKPGKNGRNGTAEGDTGSAKRAHRYRPSTKAKAVPIAKALIAEPHQLKPWTPVARKPGIVAIGLLPLILAGMSITILGPMITAGITMVTPLAVIAMWILAAKKTVGRVVVIRLIDDQPVFDWQWWEPSQIAALPAECKWQFNDKPLPVIDLLDPEQPKSLMPFSETPPVLSSEKLGEAFIQDDSQFIGQMIGGRTTVQALQLGAALIVIGALLMINYVMINKAFEGGA